MRQNFPDYYAQGSERRILTPSVFARENLFYVQEAGHIRLQKSHAGLVRSSLDSYLLVAVAAGSGSLQYQGERYELRAGQCFWVDCRRPHGYRSDPADPWELRWVHFNGRSAPGFYRLFTEKNPPVFAPADFDGICRALDAVLAAARAWDAAAELRASAEIAALLTAVLVAPAGDALPAGAAARLEEVRAYLAEHCAEPLTLDALSARFFVSKYYLARSFKQRYGLTVFEYLIEARMDAAKQMLRYTELGVGQVAARCGFREQSYFTRRFRQAEGIPPQQYRRAWRGQKG